MEFPVCTPYLQLSRTHLEVAESAPALFYQRRPLPNERRDFANEQERHLNRKIGQGPGKVLNASWVLA
jgi:hypothetical protein